MEPEEEGAAAKKFTQYRVLGTFPNVMPRRQLVAYYRLYLELKAGGRLPTDLQDNPYQAMQASVPAQPSLHPDTVSSPHPTPTFTW